MDKIKIVDAHHHLWDLENKETSLEESLSDYQRLIQLNKHVDNLFKKLI